jgi:predicted nucleotidyltransferase
VESQSLEAVCQAVVARLERISGIVAIVLGGSHARGTARPDSDVDIGLYYEPDSPFSIDDLTSAARDLNDRHADNLMTQFGDWGPGVNGGGWLEIEGRKVDLLYRDLRRVRGRSA